MPHKPRAAIPSPAAAAILSEAVCLVVLVAVPSFLNLSTERIFEEAKTLLLRAAALVLLALVEPAILLYWRA